MHMVASTKNTRNKIQNNQSMPSFPNKYYSLLAGTIFTFLFLFVVGSNLTDGLSELLIIFGAIIIGAQLLVLYYIQSDYIRQFYPQRKIKAQLALLFWVAILPALGLIIGELHGASHFNTPGESLVSSAVSGLVVSVFVGLFYLFIFITGNAVFIQSQGRLNESAVIIRFFYGVGYLALLVLAWFMYSVTYTFHDPNTE